MAESYMMLVRLVQPASFVPGEVKARWHGLNAPRLRSGRTEFLFLDQNMLSIRVNGAHRRVAAGISVADLAHELGLDPAKVAVERNLEIVPRSTLAQVAVAEGDEFEIVTFVGGG
jgi:thiamine biosynthesis protein ThiS